MEMNDFIKNIADQFDDTEFSEFLPETKFRDLDEWSSLTTLAVITIVEKKYKVTISPEEFRTVNTIQELYDLVLSKQ